TRDQCTHEFDTFGNGGVEQPPALLLCRLAGVALDPCARERRPPGHDLERAVRPVHGHVVSLQIAPLVDSLLHFARVPRRYVPSSAAFATSTASGSMARYMDVSSSHACAMPPWPDSRSSAI